MQRVEFADGLTKLDYRAFGNCDSLGIVAPNGSFAAKYAERNGFRRAAPEK